MKSLGSNTLVFLVLFLCLMHLSLRSSTWIAPPPSLGFSVQLLKISSATQPVQKSKGHSQPCLAWASPIPAPSPPQNILFLKKDFSVVKKVPSHPLVPKLKKIPRIRGGRLKGFVEKKMTPIVSRRQKESFWANVSFLFKRGVMWKNWRPHPPMGRHMIFSFPFFPWMLLVLRHCLYTTIPDIQPWFHFLKHPCRSLKRHLWPKCSTWTNALPCLTMAIMAERQDSSVHNAQKIYHASRPWKCYFLWNTTLSLPANMAMDHASRVNSNNLFFQVLRTGRLLKWMLRH